MRKNAGIGLYVDLKDVRDTHQLGFILKATPAECKELAKRLKILEVIDLDAQITVRQGARPDLFKVMGRITAHVIQQCSATLDPVPEAIDEELNETLTTSEIALNEVSLDEADDDAPVELIENERIDIREIISQWMGLALDPYPRSDAPPAMHIEEEAGPAVQTPFQVLEALKNKK